MTSNGSPDYKSPHHRHSSAFGALGALSMAVGRGSLARRVAKLAELTTDDQVVDVGCGPGTAVRVAASRCANATGVDPSPAMLRLGRWLNALRGTRNVTLLQGSAEGIPLPDDAATVIWALNSVHHWNDRSVGLAEALRVLAPNGRLLLVERLIEPGNHGGLTGNQVVELKTDVESMGFTIVRRESLRVGRRTFNVISASRELVR